jgi:hypothetical protein
MLRTVVQIPGRRHDVNGLYALLKRSVRGLVLGDNAYSPRPKKRTQLERRGIAMVAAKRSDAKKPLPEAIANLLKQWRPRVERRIANFNQQFCAHRTLNRSALHYVARRWMKATAHNIARLINLHNKLPRDSYAHFWMAA